MLAPATAHTVTGLPCVGMCYFAAKATNSQGESSRFSGEATKLMGQLALPGLVTDTVITWKESGLIMDISATINISDINKRNPIQSKQGSPERGYVFEVPSGSAPRVLTLENWPAGTSSPTMVRGTTKILPNVTYTVRVTHDGTTARLYLNGVLDGEVVTPPPRENSQIVRDCRYRWSSSYDVSFNGTCQVQ